MNRTTQEAKGFGFETSRTNYGKNTYWHGQQTTETTQQQERNKRKAERTDKDRRESKDLNTHEGKWEKVDTIRAEQVIREGGKRK